VYKEQLSTQTFNSTKTGIINFIAAQVSTHYQGEHAKHQAETIKIYTTSNRYSSNQTLALFFASFRC